MTLCGENINEQKENWWVVISKNRIVDGRGENAKLKHYKATKHIMVHN